MTARAARRSRALPQVEDIEPLPKDWRGRRVVILRGGARDQRCYFHDDVEHMLRIAERTGTDFPYHPTGLYDPHPTHPSATCEIWRYNPAIRRTA